MEFKVSLTPKQAEAWHVIENSDVIELGYGGAARGGKLVPNDGVVLTPFGYKKGIDLKTGDILNNPDGSKQRIIQISQEVHLPKWVVSFSDGTKTEVAKEHLWNAWKGRKSRKINNIRTFGEASAEVVETQELKQWLERGYNPQIPICKAQTFNLIDNEKYKIDPYLLGVLLGDGCITSSSIQITCDNSDKDHYKKILGESEVTYITDKTIRFVGEKRKHIVSKLEYHKLLGTRSKTKFIPKSYKYASIYDRISIVQGLMDTDGWSAKGKNAIHYDSISKDLSDDMAFIIRSLGGVVTITKGKGSYKKDGVEIICNDVYHLYIKFKNPDSLFRMKRKHFGSFGKNLIQKSVVSVEVEGMIKGRCITVSNPNGLYITNDFIVTHNSWLFMEYVTYMSIAYPDTRWAVARKELKNLRKTTIKTLFKVFQSHNLKDGIDYTYNKKEEEITFVNSSQIIFIALGHQPSDPLYLNLGGLEITGGVIEESNEVNITAIQIFHSRCGNWNNKKYDIKPILLHSFNPDKGHVYHRLYKPWKMNKLPKERAFIPALPIHNPYVEPAWFKMIKTADKITKERLLYGNFEYEDDPTRKFDTDALSDMFYMKPLVGMDKYMTVDIARMGKDSTVIMLWKGFYLYKVIVKQRQGTNITEDLINYWALREGIPRSHIVADEDGVGGGVIDHLPGINGFVNGSSAFKKKILKDAHGNNLKMPENFGNLKTQCYFASANSVNKNEVGIYDTIPEKIKELLIEDLEQIKEADPHKEKKIYIISKEKIKEKLGRSTDYGDAFMMRWFFEVRPKNKSKARSG